MSGRDHSRSSSGSGIARVSSSLAARRSARRARFPAGQPCRRHQARNEPVVARCRFQVRGARPPHSALAASASSSSVIPASGRSRPCSPASRSRVRVRQGTGSGRRGCGAGRRGRWPGPPRPGWRPSASGPGRRVGRVHRRRRCARRAAPRSAASARAARRLRLIGHQPGQRPAEPDRLATGERWLAGADWAVVTLVAGVLYFWPAETPVRPGFTAGREAVRPRLTPIVA
jgi:hypothetical protein